MMKHSLFFLLLSALPAFAQFPDLQFLVGTSIEDGEGKTWAYLRWQAPDPQVLIDQKTAIFRKDGQGNSADLFELQGICQLNRQPATIKVLLNRGRQLGDNLTEFEADLDRLFDNIGIDPALLLEEKVAAIIGVAEHDPDVYSTLTFFAQSHPAMGLCIGQGFAVEISGVNPGTFEARRCPDSLTDPQLDCHRVVGRVTVDPTVVSPLPAPGAPVEVAEPTAKGHLSVRLRWSTPDALRRENLLQFGFNLYRVEQAYAEANGWHLSPPIDPFRNYDPNFVHLINDLPILPNPNLTEAEATNTNDTETLFMIDDNEVFNGGTPFNNGDAFYYFVTARDVLGRDGASSAGTLITLCDRLPPNPPKNVRVANTYTWGGNNVFTRQRLEISWDAITGARGEIPLAYGVFRWENARGPGLATNETLAMAHLISPPILHTGEVGRVTFVDDALGSPNAVNDAGKTYWYTVRAIDDGACGGNMGPDSAPAPGVLRDRQGPNAPTGSLRIVCANPDVNFQAPFEFLADPYDDQALDPTLHVQVDCVADPTYIDWVQFSYGQPGNSTNVSPRIYLNGRTTVDHLFAIERDPPGSGVLSRITYCRAGGAQGGVSDWRAASLFTLSSEPFLYVVHFTAHVGGLDVVPVSPACRIHRAANPESEFNRPHVNPTQLTINLTPGTEEWRIYRRIDQGPLSLIEQGFDSFTDDPVIGIADTNLPVNASVICYFAQLADEHGNVSPMTRIECIEVSSRIPLPAPLINPVEAAGVETNQQMRISWFCSPEPVETFEIWVKAQGARRQIHTSEPTNDPRPPTIIRSVASDWQVYETRRIGPAYAAGPDFDYTLNIEPGWQYIVQVRGISRTGEASPFSAQEPFTWAPPTPPAVQEVPWPARSLPPVEADAIAKVTATTKTFGDPSGVQVRMGAIRIGEYFTGNPDGGWEAEYDGDDGPGSRSGEIVLHVPPTDEGDLTLYTAQDGKSVFPCVIYRYQVANGAFPEVSGDVYQVTPLLAEETIFEKSGNDLTIWSPFLDVSPLHGGTANEYGLFIQDTQPVLRNAAYKYLIVRFKDNGEIDKVMPTNVYTAQ